jgi:hypothetical protein
VQHVLCGGRPRELRASVPAGATPRRRVRAHRRLPASWCTAARSRPGPGGLRSCRSVDIGSRHYACRLRSTLVPDVAGGIVRTLWGLGAPKPLPDRSGLSFEWSFTGGLGAARAPYVCQSSRETPGFLLRDMAVCAAAVEGPWTATRAPADCCDVCVRPGMRNISAAGQRQGKGRSEAPCPHGHLDIALSATLGDAREGRTQTNAAATGRVAARGRTASRLIPPGAGTLAREDWHRHP